MKKTMLTIALASTISFVLFAQKTVNDPLAEKRVVGSFHGIEVGTGIELVITPSAQEEVAVSAAKAEYRDKIVTRVENGTLKIYYETKTGSINRVGKDKKLRAWVSYTKLDKLAANTGAGIEWDGALKAGSLDMKANTGGVINGEIQVSNLTLSQNTGSKVMLTGKAGTLNVDGDTGSRFTGEKLETENCSVSVSTGAKVSVNAGKDLQVKASTGARVTYRGSAGLSSVKTSTGGTVSKI